MQRLAKMGGDGRRLDLHLHHYIILARMLGRMSDGRLGLWWVETRPQYFASTVLPVVLGTLLAIDSGHPFRPLPTAVALGGLLALHAATNAINVYFDFVNGTDVVNRNRTPFNGGTGILPSGRMSPGEVRSGALLLFALGGLSGLYLGAEVAWGLLALFLLGAAMGYLYVQPTINLSRNGLGELACGAAFGPLMGLAGFMVQSGEFAWEAVIVPLPLGLLLGAILWANQIPDYEADMATGKTNWVVRLGKERSSKAYGAIMVAVAASIALPPLLSIVPPYHLAALAPMPLAAAAARDLRRGHARHEGPRLVGA